MWNSGIKVIIDTTLQILLLSYIPVDAARNLMPTPMMPDREIRFPFCGHFRFKFITEKRKIGGNFGALQKKFV